MNIYLLQKRKDLPDNEKENPWYPWYDKQHGVMVRAKNERGARKLAARCCQDEGISAWLCEKYSTCEHIKTLGVTKSVILKDIRYG